MEPERQGRRRSFSWSDRGRATSRPPFEEEPKDPFADDITPAVSQGGRSRGRPQQRGSNAFSNPNPFQTAPQDVFDSPRYEDPFADARARNRAQFVSNNPWQDSAPIPNPPASFASHLFQPRRNRGNNFPSQTVQDVFQMNAAESSQKDPEFTTTSMGTSFAFSNANDSSKPPKYPFKNRHGQKASSFGGLQPNHGLAPRKQFTPFENELGVEEVEEWPVLGQENAERRSWMETDTDEKTKAPPYTGERLSLFIRSVPVSLFSTRAITDHFERLPVTVSNVSLRGSKQRESNRTAVVTFESAREASLAYSKGRIYNGTVLNVQFYEPYEVRKNARIKEREEAKRKGTESSKLVLSQVPHGIASARQLKRVLDERAEGIVDVKLSQRPGAEGMQRIAIITMWDDETAEALLKSKLRYNSKRLSFLNWEEVKYEDAHMEVKTESSRTAMRRTSRKEKETKQMTEQERLREMEQLRREIAIIEEKKRQQEARKERELSQGPKRRSISRESHGKTQLDTHQAKADARFSKYGAQNASVTLEAYAPAKNENWRKVGQKMDIQDAKQFVGVCVDMCPRSEFISRVEQRDISLFELRDGPGSEPDSTKAVKKYRRSAAISEEQKPDEVRPPPILAKTMDHLKKVCDFKRAEFHEIHNFVRDRTRSIRQDFTLQGIRDECCIKIHEESVRFHIMSEHRLYGTGPAQFSSKQNLEQLDKCLISLREMYDLRREQNLSTSPNEPEMQAYYILTQMSDPQTCVQLWTGFAQDVRQSAPVKFALEVVQAARGQFSNPVRFFSCVRRAPYLMACLMHSRFTQMRIQALRLLNSAYGSANSQDEIALDTLTKRLCFEDEEQTRQFCELLGFEVFPSMREDVCQQIIAPPCRTFDTSRISLFRTTRSNAVIESKASQLSPSEIIDGVADGWFANSLNKPHNAFRTNKAAGLSHSAQFGEDVRVPEDSLLQQNAVKADTTETNASQAFNIETDQVQDQHLRDEPLIASDEAQGKKQRGSLLGLFPLQADPTKHNHSFGSKPEQSSTVALLLRESLVKPVTSSASVQTPKDSAAVHISGKQSGSEPSAVASKKRFSKSEKSFLTSANDQDTRAASASQILEPKGNKSAVDWSRGLSQNIHAFTNLEKSQGTVEHAGVERHEQTDSAVQTVGADVIVKEVSHLARKGDRGLFKSGVHSDDEGLPVGKRMETDHEEEGQRKLREMASRVVEERQRIVAIAKQARVERHRRRCDKVLSEFARQEKLIEESMKQATAVIQSLTTGGMSRSDALNACHSGFEYLDRASAVIKRAEEFLREAKGWSWEGQEFPPLPFSTLSKLRENGSVAWEKLIECRSIALRRSPEPPRTDEHAKKDFSGEGSHVVDMTLPLGMSIDTITDRIPILSLPTDDSIPNPGSEVNGVFETLRKLGVLQWQVVVVGEQRTLSGANGITTAWLHARLEKNVGENGMVMNGRNTDIVRYPCLSLVRVERDDALPVTASVIIWSLDGSKGESGLHEDQRNIERCLSELQSRSESAPTAPPFLVLVCFNAMGPISSGLKEELEKGCESEWTQSLMTLDLVCGVRCIVLSRQTVLKREPNSEFTAAIQESVSSHRSRSVSRHIDLQLQMVGDRLVEVGNEAWMEVLDNQLSRAHKSHCNQLLNVIRNINNNWHGLAKKVSNNAKLWPTEFSYHRVHFFQVGAELIRRMQLPIPSESDGHNYARYLRHLCTTSGIAYPKIQGGGFQGLVEFCRSLGIIMPRLVSSLLRDLNDVEIPLPRTLYEEWQTSRVHRLNILFNSVFTGADKGAIRDSGDRMRNNSSLGKRRRGDDIDDGSMDILHENDSTSPLAWRRLSLNEEYRQSAETPKRRFSLPWKTFGSWRWSERHQFILAEVEAFGAEIDATIELIKKRRKVAELEPHLVASG
eukprot:TRINITY_DN376_c1_g1_i1.p1 TRINITY_DN376_c1_g1~~TRINITY_DN376_c1_g1_i1.p1  ORF type:complete len:1902 (+),score=260.39 TRINITY_DN376_c1_g1_i1:25045-30750(+)